MGQMRRLVMTVRWSVYVALLENDGSIRSVSPKKVPNAMLRTASVGKLLLGEFAGQLESVELKENRCVSKHSAPVRPECQVVACTGVDWSLIDACRLLGAMSDNLAMNVLLGAGRNGHSGIVRRIGWCRSDGGAGFRQQCLARTVPAG